MRTRTQHFRSMRIGMRIQFRIQGFMTINILSLRLKDIQATADEAVLNEVHKIGQRGW
jgi:hypothetical protein